MKGYPRTAVSTQTQTRNVHPVDQVPPAPKLAALGLQHVLAFYAGAVIVPLLIAQSLNLDAATTIHLINADLLTCVANLELKLGRRALPASRSSRA